MGLTLSNKEITKTNIKWNETFNNLKQGAKKFINIIDEATDNTQDGQIGNGRKIGIVSFADVATQNT